LSRLSPLSEFRTRRRIEFSDTDMGGIAHFARFFVFMETAEHEFLNAIGTSVHLDVDGQAIGWPRVAATCEYLSPARFGEVLDIYVRVLRKGEKSMSYGFEITRGETAIARGKITSVCCVLNDPAGVRAIPIPDFIADRIEEAR
jgi:4-hydroxybenzoyl-CoA thioesterase/acyl-CoA thioester hydrolase